MKMWVSDKKVTCEAVCFNAADMLGRAEGLSHVDMVYYPKLRNISGIDTFKLEVEDLKIAEWKSLMISELTDEIAKEKNFYVGAHSRLKSEEMNNLRRQLEQISSRYLVLKNTVARIAIKGAGFEPLNQYITGPVGLIFAGTDPVQTARLLSRFGKEHESFKFAGGYLNGSPIDAERIKYLAGLPGRNELIAKAVYTIKAPLAGLVGVLNNTLCGFLYALQAIKDKKEVKGG